MQRGGVLAPPCLAAEAVVRAKDGGYGIDMMQGGVAGWFKRRGAGDFGVCVPDRDPGEIPGRDPGVVERGREEEGETDEWGRGCQRDVAVGRAAVWGVGRSGRSALRLRGRARAHMR